QSAARRREAEGRWDLAVAAYSRIAAQLGWRGGARDRIQVLSTYIRLSATERASLLPQLQRYLWAMHQLDVNRPVDAIAGFQKIAADTSTGFLREHALYQLASAEYQRGNRTGAIAGYQTVLTSNPRGSKTEEALIMLARASILT